jgi:hypothetical protein
MSHLKESCVTLIAARFVVDIEATNNIAVLQCHEGTRRLGLWSNRKDLPVRRAEASSGNNDVPTSTRSLTRVDSILRARLTAGKVLRICQTASKRCATAEP